MTGGGQTIQSVLHAGNPNPPVLNLLGQVKSGGIQLIGGENTKTVQISLPNISVNQQNAQVDPNTLRSVDQGVSNDEINASVLGIVQPESQPSVKSHTT